MRAASAGTVPNRPAIESLLNSREVEIVRMLAHAMPNKRIARALGLSVETVKWHLKNIYVKLEATGRDDVIERLRAQATPGPSHPSQG